MRSTPVMVFFLKMLNLQKLVSVPVLFLSVRRQSLNAVSATKFPGVKLLLMPGCLLFLELMSRSAMKKRH